MSSLLKHVSILFFELVLIDFSSHFIFSFNILNWQSVTTIPMWEDTSRRPSTPNDNSIIPSYSDLSLLALRILCEIFNQTPIPFNIVTPSGTKPHHQRSESTPFSSGQRKRKESMMRDRLLLFQQDIRNQRTISSDQGLMETNQITSEWTKEKFYNKDPMSIQDRLSRIEEISIVRLHRYVQQGGIDVFPKRRIWNHDWRGIEWNWLNHFFGEMVLDDRFFFFFSTSIKYVIENHRLLRLLNFVTLLSRSRSIESINFMRLYGSSIWSSAKIKSKAKNE